MSYRSIFFRRSVGGGGFWHWRCYSPISRCEARSDRARLNRWIQRFRAGARTGCFRWTWTYSGFWIESSFPLRRRGSLRKTLPSLRNDSDLDRGDCLHERGDVISIDEGVAIHVGGIDVAAGE